jgi:integrase
MPQIGALRLDKIGVGTVEKLGDGLRKQDYAPRSVNTIIRILGAVFRSAILRGEISTNPVERVERSFMAAHELRGDEEAASTDDTVSPDSILSPDEIRLMLEQTSPGLYRALFTTAALTGARSGELFALRWTVVEMPDGRQGYIYIRAPSLGLDSKGRRCARATIPQRPAREFAAYLSPLNSDLR